MHGNADSNEYFSKEGEMFALQSIERELKSQCIDHGILIVASVEQYYL